MAITSQKESSLPEVYSINDEDKIRVLVGGVVSADVTWPVIKDSILGQIDTGGGVTLSSLAQSILSISLSQISLQTQGKNKVWAGPITGIDTTPTFRELNSSDLPPLADGSITLSKFAPIASATILGRKSTGVGIPEALSALDTKVLLALDQVDNTADLFKPISIATGNALGLKSPINNPLFTGNVGIETPLPASRLHITANDTLNPTVRLKNSNIAGQVGISLHDNGLVGSDLVSMFVHTNPFAAFLPSSLWICNYNAEAIYFMVGDSYPKLTISGNGNVGVITTSPLLPLSVKGTVGPPATSGTTPIGVARFENSSNNIVTDFGHASASPYGAWIQATDKTNLALSLPLILNPNGGNVGIGTVTPLTKLHIVSDIATWAGRNIITSGNPVTTEYCMGTLASDVSVRGISNTGMVGVLGYSRVNDIVTNVPGAMLAIGVFGVCTNNSTNMAGYALYTEARKKAENSTASTAAGELAILNGISTQYDITPSSNPGGATVGLAITSGVTYEHVNSDGTGGVVPYYDASVGLLIAPVGAKFRRGIVILDNALTDHGGSKLIAMALPNSARIAWVNDDNCIIGNTTTINTLIGNTIITYVDSSGLTIPNNKAYRGLKTTGYTRVLARINSSDTCGFADDYITVDTANLIGLNGNTQITGYVGINTPATSSWGLAVIGNVGVTGAITATSSIAVGPGMAFAIGTKVALDHESTSTLVVGRNFWETRIMIGGALKQLWMSGNYVMGS